MLKIEENIDLSKYTTFKIGGKARFFIDAKNEEDIIESIKYAKENSIDFFILAGGSNLLVSDKGFDGIVIKISNSKLEINKEEIVADAGVSFFDIVLKSVESSLSGLEWAAGIPGTVGGAVVGNAGAFGGEIKDNLLEARIYDVEKDEVRVLKNDECDFTYRNSFFKNNYKKIILLSAKFLLEKGNKKESKKNIKETIGKRKDNQPQYPSAGSFFKNPFIDDKNLTETFERDKGVEVRGGKLPVGWFIERLELKGKSIGGAQISKKHANFIINTGNASAEDVIILSSLIKEKLRNHYNIQLQEEVRMVGF
jgi:UDP-N-acetylmuramate dehydrogenase